MRLRVWILLFLIAGIMDGISIGDRKEFHEYELEEIKDSFDARGILDRYD